MCKGNKRGYEDDLKRRTGLASAVPWQKLCYHSPTGDCMNGDRMLAGVTRTEPMSLS